MHTNVDLLLGRPRDHVRKDLFINMSAIGSPHGAETEEVHVGVPRLKAFFKAQDPFDRLDGGQ